MRRKVVKELVLPIAVGFLAAGLIFLWQAWFSPIPEKALIAPWGWLLSGASVLVLLSWILLRAIPPSDR